MSQRPNPPFSATAPVARKKNRTTNPSAVSTTQQSISAGPRRNSTANDSDLEIVSDPDVIAEIEAKAKSRTQGATQNGLKRKRTNESLDKGKKRADKPASASPIEIVDSSEDERPPPKRPRNTHEIIILSDSDDNSARPPAVSTSKPKSSAGLQTGRPPSSVRKNTSPIQQKAANTPLRPTLAQAGPSKPTSRGKPKSTKPPSRHRRESFIVVPRKVTAVRERSASPIAETSAAAAKDLLTTSQAQDGFSLTNAVKTWKNMRLHGSPSGSPSNKEKSPADAPVDPPRPHSLSPPPPPPPPPPRELPVDYTPDLSEETTRLANDPRRVRQSLHEVFLVSQGEMNYLAKEMIASLQERGAEIDEPLITSVQTEVLHTLTSGAETSGTNTQAATSTTVSHRKGDAQTAEASHAPSEDQGGQEEQEEEEEQQEDPVVPPTVPEPIPIDEDGDEALQNALALSKVVHNARGETEDDRDLRLALEESMRVNISDDDENNEELQHAITQSISMASVRRSPSPTIPMSPEPLFYPDPERTPEPEDESEVEEDPEKEEEERQEEDMDIGMEEEEKGEGPSRLPDNDTLSADQGAVDSSAGSSPTDEHHFPGFPGFDPKDLSGTPPDSPSSNTSDEAFRTVGEVKAAQAEPVPPMFGRPMRVMSQERSASPPFPGQESSKSSSGPNPVASKDASPVVEDVLPKESAPSSVSTKPQLSVKTSTSLKPPPLPRRPKPPTQNGSSATNLEPATVSSSGEEPLAIPTSTQRPPLPSKKRRRAAIATSQFMSQRTTTVPRFQGKPLGLEATAVGTVTANLPRKRKSVPELPSKPPIQTGLTEPTEALSLVRDHESDSASSARRRSTPVSDGLAGLVEDQLHVASPEDKYVVVDGVRLSPARVEMDLDYDFEYDEEPAPPKPAVVEGNTGDVSSEDALDLLPPMRAQPMLQQPIAEELMEMPDLFSESVLVEIIEHAQPAQQSADTSEPESPTPDDDSLRRVLRRRSSRYSAASSSSSSLGPATPNEESPSHVGVDLLLSRQFREIVLENPVPYKKAKDIPTSFEDAFNARTESAKMDAGNRLMFESWMQFNTMDDEPHAPTIRLQNFVDTEPCPKMEFHYSNEIWHSDLVPPPRMKDLKHCDCVGSCSSPKNINTCPCLARQKKMLSKYERPFKFTTLYNEEKRLISPSEQFMITECNDLCGCDESCMNRVVQLGRQVKIKIAKTQGKGWGVFSDETEIIPKGTFIGIYAGELMRRSEEYKRALYYDDIVGRTYIFHFDFHWLLKAPNKYFMDAFHVGNFTRYVNHSCEPNITVQGVYINEANKEKPLMCMFTHQDVRPGAELCFSYLGADDELDEEQEQGKKGKGKEITQKGKHGRCECGALRCKRGYIFG